MPRHIVLAVLTLIALCVACSGASAPVLPECYGASRPASEYACSSDYGGIDSTKRTAPVQDGAEACVKDVGEACVCPPQTACFTANVGEGFAAVFCALGSR